MTEQEKNSCYLPW